jgi:hypothetical protein
MGFRHDFRRLKPFAEVVIDDPRRRAIRPLRLHLQMFFNERLGGDCMKRGTYLVPETACGRLAKAKGNEQER